jgi:uncharacterized Zn finger protein (UPF0148 family)
MSKIEIHLTYDKDGKAYTLCNRCGTKFRYKGGSAFCKEECQIEWNKIRDAKSRAAKIKRNREAEEKELAITPEIQEAMEVERLIKEEERRVRVERIKNMRAEHDKKYKEKREHQEQYGEYKKNQKWKKWR